MKKTFLIIALFFGGYSLFAQVGDTTKIKLGDTKIIIIDKEKDSKTKEEKLESARKEFEKLLEEKKITLQEKKIELEKLNQEMQAHAKNLELQQDEQLRKEEEKKVQELNNQVSEMNKKVQELNKEVNALNKGINHLDKDFDIDMDDDKDCGKSDHDWNFKENWPKDWDNLSPFGSKDKFRGHWAGFELGLNNYLNANNSIGLADPDRGFELEDARSWVFAINFLEFNIPFGKNAGLVTGLGTSWNNYHFRNNVNISEDVDGIMVATPEIEKSYTKNTLNTWSFSVPLILEFQLPSDKGGSGVFLGAGVYGSAVVSSQGKIEYKLDGVSYEENRKSDFLLNTFSYGITARLGFKYLRLFANYNLVPLFLKDRGPELFPVSVGISLLSF